MCLLQLPSDKCAAIPPLASNPASSRWHLYQTIVSPSPGTRSLKLFLYADVYKAGTLTVNEYSDVVVRSSRVLLQPVVAASTRSHEHPATVLYPSGESFSPDWIGPPNDARVEVDGLRNGWLGPLSSNVRPSFGPSSWYLLSRFVSLLAAVLLLAIAFSLWPSRRRISGLHLGGQKRG